MTFKEYRENYQYKFKDEIFIGYFVSVPLSFLLNKLCYKESLTPNKISFLMLIVGVIGGALFFVDMTEIKIVGFVFMHLWFVFDAWDGAVARQTKKFSDFGKEFDYLVHVIVHPIMLTAFMFSVDGILRNLILAYLIMNTIKRGIYMLDFSRNHKLENSGSGKSIYNLKIFIIDFFSNGPNYLLIAPIFYFIGLNTTLFVYTILFICFDTLQNLMQVRKYLRIYLS